MFRYTTGLLLLLCTAGCPFGFALPPSQSELSPVTVATGDKPATGFRAAVGASWASATLRADDRFDVGAGYVYERHSNAQHRTNNDEQEIRRSLHGGYLSFGTPLHRQHNQRSWASARAELLFDDGVLVPGLSTRLSWELFAAADRSTPLDDPCAVGVAATYGKSAIGFFFDAGYRRTSDHHNAAVVSAGLSIRLPSLTIFGLFIPGCK